MWTVGKRRNAAVIGFLTTRNGGAAAVVDRKQRAKTGGSEIGNKKQWRKEKSNENRIA
jgi:hypothetical protein